MIIYSTVVRYNTCTGVRSQLFMLCISTLYGLTGCLLQLRKHNQVGKMYSQLVLNLHHVRSCSCNGCALPIEAYSYMLHIAALKLDLFLVVHSIARLILYSNTCMHLLILVVIQVAYCIIYCCMHVAKQLLCINIANQLYMHALCEYLMHLNELS